MFCVLTHFAFHSNAQVPTQIIRGVVVDEITQSTLPGATVVVADLDPVMGVNADMNGTFRLDKVPVGYHTIKVVMMGYEDLVRPNVLLNSGKELVLMLALREKLVQVKEVTITAELEKQKAINEMSLVSTRTFSVEETQKFAAAVNDPARMVSSFAGVLSTDDGNNNVSIRGNSPNGLQWRMEGVEIPSPNHFAFPGTAGGGVSILSAQLLSNSDFLTGAFNAEYGNALSGVFDLKLRKGNNEKNEFTFQANLLGLDVATEGPFSKNYNGSYLINYRYSTLTMITKFLDLGDAITDFQDLSFNLFLPTNKFGQFTIFGFGGLSSQDYEATKDSSKWEEEYERFTSDFVSNTGAVGITHSLRLSKKLFLRTAVVTSKFENKYKEKRLSDFYEFENREDSKTVNDRYLISTNLNYKVNARNVIKSGIVLSALKYSIYENSFDAEVDSMVTSLDIVNSTNSIQAYSTWMNRVTKKLTSQVGIHYIGLALNNSFSIEPRVSFSYDLSEQNTLSIGYGLHSQIQPLGIYFAEAMDSSGNIYRPNEKLELTKSHHFVFGYNQFLKPWLHFKVELYYQYLFDVPISTDTSNSFSVLNLRDGYYPEALTNDGLGNNYGLELSIEQFIHHDLYFLFSSSIYESKYRDNVGKWRNTLYNGNYTFTFTGGKEITTGSKFKNRIIGLNIKVIYAGGLRTTPIDVEKSMAEESTYYFEKQAFTGQNPAYFRTDIRISMKRNRPKATHILSLDVQNVTNQMNVFGDYFDVKSGKVKTYYQTPLIPILGYRIEF
ncbi:MAG: TonB-dependent receptor [Bacteroidetes bacterium]|nr:TonB-dependent receptor [Bacteroidota bacterium]